MLKVREISSEVLVADAPLVDLGPDDIEFLKSRVDRTSRRRIRICAHRDVGDKLHEMFIVMAGDTYIRPHKHLDRVESMHVVEGSADAVFFDETGNVDRVVRLGDYSSGCQFFYRISEPVYHCLLVRSQHLVVHETTEGPWSKSGTVFADWAPAEDDLKTAGKYREELEQIADGS